MPSQDEGIAGFLRARYAEQRAVALAATAGPWRAEPYVYGPESDGWGTSNPWEIKAPQAEVVGHQPYEGGGVAEGADAQHIAAWGPDVVLADLDAKLAILDEHPSDGSVCTTCAEEEDFDDDVDGNRTWSRHGKWFPCPTLRHLAVPFAAHPDYDESWRP